MLLGSILNFSTILIWLLFNASVDIYASGIGISKFTNATCYNHLSCREFPSFAINEVDHKFPAPTIKTTILNDAGYHRCGKAVAQNPEASSITLISPSRELIIIDGDIPHNDNIIDYLVKDPPNRRLEVAYLKDDSDGVEQVSSLLRQYRNLNAVHFVSHGVNGNLFLGNTRLSLENLHLYAEQIERWGLSLSDGADLLLYGCELASNEQGLAMVRAIQRLTKADVAASYDNTGHHDYGADWELECNLGKIETMLPFDDDIQNGWQGVLSTFIVTNTKNGGGGSLRKAINDANLSGGVDNIHFNIPLNDPNHVYYKDDGIPGSLSLIATTTLADASISDFDPDYPGTPFSWYRISLTTRLPIILTRVILDGTSQLTFDGRTGLGYPVIELEGTSLTAADPNGLTIESNSSEIRGLAINRFTDDAIEIEFGDNNLIVGNFIGTDVTGSIAQGNEWGINLKSAGNTIGGTTAADRNIISGNLSDGIYIFGEAAQDNSIIGNYIGTDATGTNPLGNGYDGIYFAEYLNQSPDNHTIGGVNPGEGNIIAFNEGSGIAMFRKTGSGHAIIGNSIHSNDILGIDFDYDGVTTNDDFDSDSGPNDQLNYPVLINVEQNGPDVDLAIFFDLPAGNYRIELFENPSGVNSSGFGEGEVFLGAVSIVSLGAGAERVAITMNSVTLTDPLTVTSTATEDLGAGDYGSTSEFGPAFLGAGVLLVDTDSDVSDGDTQSVPHLLSNRGADGLISLREALTAANNSPNLFATDEIQFNISGGGVQTIQPTGPLPWPTEAVIVDGTTQPGYAGTPLIQLDGQLAGSSVAGLGLNTGSDGSEIRGLAIYQFSTNGILVLSDGNTIAGNYFGLDASGTNAPGNANRGIYVSGSSNIIGGSIAADRNVISGNGDNGIDIIGNNNDITGNYVGTDASGTADLGNGARGIYLYNLAANNTIGGTASGESNLIAYNASQGISLHNTANSGNSILSNQIHSNDGIGIDLGEDGITYNDNNDSDGGPNGALNFPVITNIAQNGSDLDITYNLEVPSGDYRVEFFENPSGVDASGFGECESLLGAVSITSAGSGPQSFLSTLSSATVADATTVTAVATEDLGAGDFGNSSEIGPAFVGAGVLIVDTDSDVDDGDTNSIAELLGNRGPDSLVSLREAIIALNNTANIDGSDKIYFNIDVGGAQTIQPTSPFPDIADDLILDGTTQPGYVSSPIIELEGSSAGNGNGLTLAAGSSGSTIRGFVINQFDRNGIFITSNDNIIESNYIGTNIDGDAAEGNAWAGIQIEGGASNNLIGGSVAAARNVISGNEDGISIEGVGTSTNAIKGNYVGTDASGMADLGNLENGILIHDDASNTTIGGSTLGEGNLISGNQSNGIGIGTGTSSASNVIIQGNQIGTDITGNSALSNAMSGIDIDDGQDVLIGGTAIHAGNTIAFNGNIGIETFNSASSTTFLGNKVFENSSLGIDWGVDGVTPNDAGDVNMVQNFPVLTSASINGLDITLDGTLNSKASTSFRIEFFANSSKDPSDHGEGETYLGFVTTTTNAAGNASFNTTITATSPIDEFITATATDLAGKTSEFSLAIVSNDIPTLTSFADVVDVTDEDTEVEITFGDLELQGDEDDTDGTIEAFIIEATFAGDLRIGADAGSATPFAAGSNEIIDVSNNAYWMPANDASGTFNVMELIVKDDQDAESQTTGVIAQVEVTPVNDPPVADNDAAVVDEGATVTIDIADGDSDVEGTLDLSSVSFSNQTNGSVINNGDGTVDFTHNGSETISASFTYTIDDNDGAASNLATVSIIVNPVNDPPSADSDAGVVDEGATVTIEIVDGDSDVDGTLDLGSISFNNQTNGSVINNGDGTVDFTHDGSETISGSFTYTIDDNDGASSNLATVSITVNPINDPPSADNDAGVVDEGATVTIDIVDGDSDVDGTLDLGSISFINQTNGSVTDNGDGTVDFTHDGSETISGSFTYTIDDNDGATSNLATVSISVNPVNDPPSADNDAGVVDEGATVTIDIVDGDSDVDGTLDLSSVSFSSQTNGSVIDNGDGTVDFTHDGSETISASFTYTIDDNHGATSNLATVSITVNPVNDPPSADNDAGVVDEGATVTIDIADGDSDVDGTLDLGSISFSNQTNGSVTDNGDGTVDFTHDGSETISGSFTYTIDDNDGATSNLATVSITVNPVNDPPSADNDVGVVDEGSTVTIDIVDGDSDVDGTLDLSSVSFSNQTNGSVINNGDGTVDFTHDGSETISGSFTYTIDDNHGATSNLATVSIIVNPVNDPPSADNDAGVVDEGATVTIDIVDGDSDVDGTLDLGSISFSNQTNGSVINNGDGTVDFTHDGSETISGSFTYTIDDNHGATSNLATVSITVNPINDPPSADNDAGVVDEGATVTIDITDGDADVDGTLDLSSVSFSNQTNGSVTDNGDGTVDFTHNGSETISASFAYTIDDNDGATSNLATVAITVNPVNDPPSADGDAGVVDEGATVTIDIVDGDSDVDGTLDLGSVSFSNQSNGNVINNGDGTVEFTHDGSETISASFTYTIDDNDGATSNLATVSITVNPVNDPPSADNDAGVVDEGATVTIDIADGDSDVDGTLDLGSISFSNQTNGSVTDNGDGTVNFTHDGSETISGGFTYTVDDNNGASSNLAAVTITVNPVNDPPVADNDAGVVDEGATVTIDIVDGDSDVDGTLDLGSVSFSNQSNGNVINNGDGTVEFTHDGSETISGSFTYTIHDYDGVTSNLASVTITVNPVNDPPSADSDAGVVDEGATVTIDIVDGDFDLDGTLDLGSVSFSNQTNGSVIDNGDGTVDYTHDGSETISGSFTYTVNDNNGATSNMATVTITVNPVNDPPMADNDAAIVDEGATVTIDITDGDADVDGTLDLSSVSFSNQTNGSVINNGDGTVDFTHDGSETISGSFTYTINDNDGVTSNLATVSITTNPVNDPPTADYDTGIVDEGATVTINIVDGDFDVDGTLDLGSISFSNQTNGSLVNNGDGTVDFTHDGSETISGSFAYTIDDNDGATSNLATVSITVNPVNDPPTFTDFSCSVAGTTIDTEIEITLSELIAQSNEYDDGGVTAFAVQSISSGTLRIGSSQASATTFAPSLNETIDGSKNAYWTPDVNQVGTVDAFELVAVDASGLESTTTGVFAKVDVISAGTDQILCSSTVTLDGTNPTSGSGTWNIIAGNGGAIMNVNNPETTLNGVPGETYQLTWEIVDGSCAPVLDTVIISLDENPSAALAGGDTTLCSNTIALFATEPVIGTGFWSITNGAGGSFADANHPSTVFNGSTGETYKLVWTVNNGSCASNSDSMTITLEENPTTAIAGDDHLECTSSVTLGANNPTIGTGHWAIASGTGGSFINANDPNTIFNGLPDEAYTLTWTIKNGSCASSTDTINVRDDKAPVFDFCPTAYEVVSMDSMRGTSIIEWELPRALDDCGTVDLTSNYNPGDEFNFGTYSVDYIAIDESGNEEYCSISFSTGFNRFPIADNLNENTLQGKPLEIVLDAFDPDGDDLSIMSIEHDTTNAIISNINPDGLSFTYTAFENFYGFDTLTVSISDNATPFNITFAQVIVEVERVAVLKISSAITLNGDGHNDHWHLENIDLFPNNTVRIYDRWGALVFQTRAYDNISAVWKGTRNQESSVGDKLVPIGTYFYMIDLGNGSEKLLGPIEVVR